MEVCSICIDELNANDKKIITECNHVYHYDCLKKACAYSKLCPNCRHEFSEDFIYNNRLKKEKKKK